MLKGKFTTNFLQNERHQDNIVLECGVQEYRPGKMMMGVCVVVVAIAMDIGLWHEYLVTIWTMAYKTAVVNR